MEDFPSNSNSNKKKQDTPEKNVERVVTSDVTRKKAGIGRRFREIFISGDDPRSVREMLFYDVVVPGVKDIVFDTINQGTEHTLYGGTGSRSKIRSNAVRGVLNAASEWTPYGSVHKSGSIRKDAGRPVAQETRANHTFDDIVIQSRVEADAVLDGLFDLLNKYDSVTVSDFYGMVGVTSNWTDQKWGWTDLRGATVERDRAGYLLNLPKPQPLR